MESVELTLNDVIYEFDKHEEAIKNLDDDKKGELLSEFREADYRDADASLHPQIAANTVKFLSTFEDDVILVVIKETIRAKANTKLEVAEPYKTIAKSFSPVIKRIKESLESAQ